MSEPIRVVEYDPNWPALYEEEKAPILRVLGSVVLDIQHIGSTAVPGAAAKPIIDIMVGVDDPVAGEKCIQPLETIGYEFRGEAGIPGRLFFGKGTPRTHHLHVVDQDGDFWKSHILFRDFLRAHPDEAERYCELKRQLAARFAADREAYTEAKAPLIESALAKARAAGAPFKHPGEHAIVPTV
jgi:GrpB-like predicted nucleotidyltransferase (UPF0157 family)